MQFSNYNESELIRKASSGDTKAFDVLMSKHEKRILAITRRMFGTQSADAEDCMVETMLRVYRALPSFQGNSSFSTWVYRIATNTCLDEIRRQKKKNQVSADALLENGWEPTDTEPDPEHSTIQKELNGALNHAIQELPEDMRAAIIYRDIHGFSYEEIAEIMSVNIGTVKSRISRGRQKLREEILSNPELYGSFGV